MSRRLCHVSCVLVCMDVCWCVVPRNRSLSRLRIKRWLMMMTRSACGLSVEPEQSSTLAQLCRTWMQR